MRKGVEKKGEKSILFSIIIKLITVVSLKKL